MKQLILSTVLVCLLIGGWLIFSAYSETRLDDYCQRIKSEILPAIEAEDWVTSQALLDELNDDWHDYKKTALFFLYTDAINEVDYSLAKSVKYAAAEDASNTSGELNSMVEQLRFLRRNDQVTWANIF